MQNAMSKSKGSIESMKDLSKCHRHPSSSSYQAKTKYSQTREFVKGHYEQKLVQVSCYNKKYLPKIIIKRELIFQGAYRKRKFTNTRIFAGLKKKKTEKTCRKMYILLLQAVLCQVQKRFQNLVEIHNLFSRHLSVTRK